MLQDTDIPYTSTCAFQCWLLYFMLWTSPLHRHAISAISKRVDVTKTKQNYNISDMQLICLTIACGSFKIWKLKDWNHKNWMKYFN